MPSVHRSLATTVGALAAMLALVGPRAAAPAAAQCTYPTLGDEVAQVFSTSPQIPRFTQSAGRWAAVAVKSGGTANWDIGLSTGSAAFPTCVSFPVVASQQSSGVDFVLGDFAAEGTGVRYAPVSRASGTGSATVEWDSGARTLVVGPGPNFGQNPPGLVDCWNVNLVAGTSYRIRLRSDQPGDFRLYAFRRGSSNSWRSKADALVEVGSNYSFPPILTATTTDRYALVVVTESATTYPYSLNLQECVDPPHLEPHVSLPIPALVGQPETAFQFEPAGPGFPTVAARAGQDGDWYFLQVAKPVAPGFYPCEGAIQAGSEVSGERVELMVGDQVSGAVPLGGSYWLGAIGSTNVEGRAEYSPGTDVVAVDGATRYVVGGPEIVARTYRADFVAGTDYRIHVAKCGAATGRLLVFRPFDPAVPGGNGWSSPAGGHAPVATVNVLGVNDFTFTPPVSGAYALVLANDSAENVCWELGISTCWARKQLHDRSTATVTANPILRSDGEAFGTLHGRGGWSAVAVRPNAAGEDWVVEAWDAPSGGDVGEPFSCLWGRLGASTEDGVASPTDFLARADLFQSDARENVETQHVYPVALASPGGGARVQYKQWNVLLSVGDPVYAQAMSPNDLVEVYNLDLVAGQTYSFLFDAEGFAGEMFLFRPTPCAGSCAQEYAHPGSANMEFRATSGRLFTAPVTATYGLVCVNQDGGNGRFWLAVNATTVDAGSGAPPAAVTRFRGAVPNPLAGGTRLDFELAGPGVVGFDIVNLAGRIVARVAGAPFETGRSSVPWAPRGEDGRRLAPGLYFARMHVDGTVVAARGKITVLP